MEEHRLDRIEEKLDRLSEAVVGLARMEERLITIFNRLDNQHIQSQPHVQSQGNNVLITKQFYR